MESKHICSAEQGQIYLDKLRKSSLLPNTHGISSPQISGNLVEAKSHGISSQIC